MRPSRVELVVALDNAIAKQLGETLLGENNVSHFNVVNELPTGVSIVLFG